MILTIITALFTTLSPTQGEAQSGAHITSSYICETASTPAAALPASTLTAMALTLSASATALPASTPATAAFTASTPATVAFQTPITATAASSQATQAPEISFERMEYDFGNMAFKSQPKTVTFRFKNTGDAPLVITRTEVSCTCLSVEFPRKPVMPGEYGTVSVTYSPKKGIGIFNNTVKIFSNSAKQNRIILFVRGVVTK